MKAEFDKAKTLHRATDNVLIERMNGAHAKQAQEPQ
jgi:hypothetical protein